jgi:hypothetical protein
MCLYDGGRISTLLGCGLAAGSVSTGLMHATPGDMKSFRSSAERIALIIAVVGSARRRLIC